MPVCRSPVPERHVTQGAFDLAQHYQVLTQLAKSEAMKSGDLAASLRQITEAAAKTMDIARVNIWLYNDARTCIHCIDHYDLASGEHSSGAELSAREYPRYFSALDEERTIVADDAHGDPRTAEFSGGYLDLHAMRKRRDIVKVIIAIEVSSYMWESGIFHTVIEAAKSAI